MKSFFLAKHTDYVTYNITIHLPQVYKFVLVEVPGEEPVLICGTRDFDWHYQIVEQALTCGIVPNTVPDSWISGGKIKNGELNWHSSVYGDVPVEQRSAVAAVLGL